MSSRLCPSIAYTLKEIDPRLDVNRDEGERRLVPLRALLRFAASKLQATELMNPISDASIGALLSSTKHHKEGAAILDSLMNNAAATKARICLLETSNKVITTEEADELDETDRAKCIPILNSTDLVMPDSVNSKHGVSRASVDASVIVTVPKNLSGGAKESRMTITRKQEEDFVNITIHPGSGPRKTFKVHKLPGVLLDKLFASSEMPLATVGLPQRFGEVPEFLKVAIAGFLEQRVRLQVMCTAAEQSPVSRPVSLDRVFMRKVDTNKRHFISVGAILHHSSSSCICQAHGMRFASKGSVEVKLETCGRPLELTDGHWRCPCHESAIDSHTGHSRFNIDGLCTEGTSLTVTCWHKAGQAAKKGVQIDSLKLTDADRLELSTILVNLAEFTTLSADLYADSKQGKPADSEGLRQLIERLKMKLDDSLGPVFAKQLTDRDAEVDNPKELLRRDMVGVDLLRSGGVFRHYVKRGERRGQIYIQRAKRTPDTQPLKPHESVIADTHGHLFRQGK